MGWLDGKIALITGAGSGIGKAVATRYLEEGCAGVVAFDRDASRLDRLRGELGGLVATLTGDVRSPEDNRKAVSLAVERFGKLDIFVGNAGVRDGKFRLDQMSDTELSDGFDEVFDINVKSCMIGTQAAREELARNRGSLIFTASTSSFYVGGGSIYIASKHAVLGLVRAFANELAPDIRVNGVAPGGTPTGFSNADALDNPATGSLPRSGGPSTNLMGIQVEAEDHAAAYVLLASDQSRFMTGAVINSDGGRGVMLPMPGPA